MICCCVPYLIHRGGRGEEKQKYVYLDEGYGRNSEAVDFIVARITTTDLVSEDKYARSAEAVDFVVTRLNTNDLMTVDKYARSAEAVDFIISKKPDDVQIVGEN